MSVPSGAPEPLPETPAEVRVRRSPKILRFLLTGALVGAVAALILTFAFPPNTQYPASQVFGFLLLIGVAIGAAVGGLIAVFIDRALQRRARVVPAVVEVTPPAPAEPDADPEEQGPGGSATPADPVDPSGSPRP
ncbi:hypothetical protein [Naasia aerilata]|uniref:Lipopolysaccharide assembly protein A domain-containing protein n=1 Tax=Naasia aerilata TaxID=1162966 RepID=A0ABN6XK66_9MICO|nr:hypothetical protein [Naasia aerilata]BDZ45249.1 hypothetical protein GCM10025866_11580 [Naasia aerilata]